jgi:L-fuconolactonase
MIEFPAVDAHHHFWDPSKAAYPWMTDELAPIRRRFGPEDLRPLLTEAGMTATVLVQTRSSLEETQEFLALAEQTDFVAGVVGWVNLTDPAVAETLLALRAGPGGDFLVGIRHQVHDEPDLDWLLRDDVRRGLEAVRDAGLAYDFLVRTRELPAAYEVARTYPELRCVVDHMAKPPVAGGEIEPWAEALEPLSRLPNVFCKLSGLVTEADWAAWRPDDLVPYVRRALAWFGPDRLMFGSDWPVSLLAAPYGRVVEAYRDALGDVGGATERKIFGENAREFYGLGRERGP